MRLCLVDVVVDYSKGTVLEPPMKEVDRLLNDGSRYSGVPPVDLNKSSCTLNAEQTQYMISIGFWTLLTESEIEDIKGICRVFTIDELFKDPARARVISWAWSVNQDPTMKVPFEMFNQLMTRFLVHQGPAAVCADAKANYNQLGLSVDVGNYHVVKTPLGWARINRSCMGATPTCRHHIEGYCSVETGPSPSWFLP